MPFLPTTINLASSNEFVSRHIGPNLNDQSSMLRFLGYSSRKEFIEAVIPDAIRENQSLPLDQFSLPMSETDAIHQLKLIANKNILYKNWIGQGYYNTITPAVIQRNILENPGWYTAYTPYQPEISQGRLEALINFQQMIIDLSGMDIANASMLDEGTAAAEAMTLALRACESPSTSFFISSDIFPQTLEVIQTRAKPLKITIIVDDLKNLSQYDVFGALIQYPGGTGLLHSCDDYQLACQYLHHQNGLLIVAADLLALTLLESPGKFGADVVVGNSQRFGVPICFGGPHAAFLATKDAYKRYMPGRLVGVSIDSNNQPAYRLALQTREQHIRREKATSNICTAQVLLAVMASMYAVYHGPDGLRNIALRTHRYTSLLAKALKIHHVKVVNTYWFDTLHITTPNSTLTLSRAEGLGINLRLIDETHCSISLDETCTEIDIVELLKVFEISLSVDELLQIPCDKHQFPESLNRATPFLTHPTFNRYHSEH